jgi:hypothetical protein
VPKHLKEGEPKEVRDFMKVEDEGVRHKRYDGRCMKQ